MLSKGIGLMLVLLVSTIGITPAFALTEIERATIGDPRLVNAFGAPIGNSVNVDQQIQVSADITNNQVKSQNFVYLVQVRNEEGKVVSLGWISGQLTPDQKLSPSLSWTPNDSGTFKAEIYVWAGLKNHSALAEYKTLQISVS